MAYKRNKDQATDRKILDSRQWFTCESCGNKFLSPYILTNKQGKPYFTSETKICSQCKRQKESEDRIKNAGEDR